MKRLQVYFRKNTPCHRWVKCSKPVVGDWIFTAEKPFYYKNNVIGFYNGTEIEVKTYSELMDYIYNQYIILDRDKKINKILEK